MYPSIYRRLFLPVYSRLKGDGSLAAYRQLCQHDDMSADEVRALGEEKLRALIRHTATHVPYYRDLFRERGLSADDIAGFDDLSRLPVVGKDDIRRAGDRWFAEDINRGELAQDSTGGSSGTPFVFFYRKQDRDLLNGNLWRADAWMGVARGTRKARVWGCGPVSKSEQLSSRYISNTIILPGHDFSDAAIAAFCRRMQRFRPAVVEGYGHLLWEFCRTIRRLDLSVPTTLRTAVFGAEGLGRPQRALIEDTLGCPVRERYGSREFLAIAAECEEGGLHITSDVNWIEIVDHAGKPLPAGQLGQITVTCLHSYAFPLIRYAIGDVGVIRERPCSCGNPHPLLQEIGGRSGNLLKLPDGTRVTGLAIAHRMRTLDRVGQVQVVQTATDALTLLINREHDTSDEDVRAVLDILEKLTKGLMEINLEYVEEIPRASSGKYELVRSKV